MTQEAIKFADVPKNRELPEIFRTGWRESAYFKLPKDAHSSKIEYVDALQRWIDFGIMPFKVLSTSVELPPENGSSFSLTSIILAKDDNLLLLLTRLDQRHPCGLLHSSLYAVYDLVDANCSCEEMHGTLELMQWHCTVEPDSPEFEWLMSMLGRYALGHFLWLTTALASISYSATEEVVSRQVSRATGQPRQSWTIHLRPARSAATSLREQFRDVVRAAHAVRGHLRADRDGRKRIRVRPHVRGRGELVQIKDYAVHQQSGIP